MTAVPTHLQLPIEQDDYKKPSLPIAARFYGILVATVALAAAVPFLIHVNGDTGHWIAFAFFATGAAFAQLFVVRHAGTEQAYHATPVFLIPAALLLPPELVALMAVLQHIPEWLKERYAWYMQSFNICMYTVTCMAAWASAHVLLHSDGLIANADLRFALAGLATVVVYVALNHGLLAPMLLNLGRGHTLRSTGIFSWESLTTDFVLAALGLGVAAFWNFNPWLIPFAIAPVLLIHRSLAVPQLQAEARVDAKTGLFNARHFANVLAEELSRATRFDRPLSLIMADLDLLRDINNTYGHLAGDAVLRGIAEVFRGELRHYDVPARFGGEEFCILLPETTPEVALEIAERIRSAVADSRVRGRDLERADPRHGVDRRRGLPARRSHRQRAHPPGRPRRLPREAAGPQPRPRRVERRCALVAALAPRTARPGRRAASRGSGARCVAAARGRAPAGRRAPPEPTPAAGRAALLLHPVAPRPLRGRHQPARHRRGRDRPRPGHQYRCRRPDRGRLARRSGAGARPRGRGGRLDLRQRRRRTRRRRALRPACRHRPRDHDLRRRVERAPRPGLLRHVQHRRPLVRIARSGRRLRLGAPGSVPQRRLRAGEPRRRRRLLRRQHGLAQHRDRPRRWQRATMGRLAGAVPLADAPLRRLRLHRRRHGARLRLGRHLGSWRSSPCRCC